MTGIVRLTSPVRPQNAVYTKGDAHVEPGAPQLSQLILKTGGCSQKRFAITIAHPHTDNVSAQVLGLPLGMQADETNVPLKLLKLKLIVKLPLLVRLKPLKSASTGETPRRTTKHQQPTRNMFRALHDLRLFGQQVVPGPLTPRSRAVV